jgi:hypothetical protein
MEIKVERFTSRESNTLKGFITVVLEDAKEDFEMAIPGFTLHEKDGRRWLEVPGRPPTNPDKDKTWGKCVEFYDKRKERKFKEKVMQELDKYLRNNNIDLSQNKQPQEDDA